MDQRLKLEEHEQELLCVALIHIALEYGIEVTPRIDAVAKKLGIEHTMRRIMLSFATFAATGQLRRYTEKE